VAAIDGPTQTPAEPADASAKLAPADPTGVCMRISAAIRTTLPAAVTARYRGAVVIDANDLGQSVLSHDTGLPPGVLAAAFADNPLGRAREQTPFAVTFQTADPELVVSPVADQGLGAGPGEPVDGGPGAGPPARPVRRIRLRSRARTS
jgi:asparagine synthase (glutamine-hydrolysing)